jgi:hypothetical protein
MTPIAFTVFAAAAVFTFASTSEAHAQAAAPAEPEDVVAAVPATPAAGATAADPNIDRGFLLPTAMTQPAGSVTYNNYELLLHGVSVGITDRVQGSVTVLSPIVKDMPFVGFAAVKGRVLSTERFHLAVQGSLGWGHAFDVDSTTSDSNLYTFGAGAFASYCLRQDCSSLASASATYQLVMPGGANNAAHMVVYGGSIVHRVGRHVKLLGEVTSAAGGTTGSNDLENLDGVLVGYGVRFHTNSIAADVGFLRPFGTGDDSEFLVGLPFVNVSYRWQ